MRLDSIYIRNFRLLRRVSLDLTADLPTTVLVGPNNSGKTSVMDALRLFAGSDTDTKRISLHDLSQTRLKVFKSIEARLSKLAETEQKIEVLRRFAPRMRLDLFFSYGEDVADLVVATDLLMSLDPSSNRVRVRIEYGLENAKALLADFEARHRKDDTLCDFLNDRYRDYFGRTFYRVSEKGDEAEALKDGGVLKRLLRIDIIPAQRHVDDDESRQAAKLSRLLHDHYTRYYKVGDAEGFNAVEDALRDSATGLTKVYEGAFERLNKRLKGYGYPPGQTTPDLRIRAEFSSQAIYQDHTRVYYASEHKTAEGPVEELILPEKYNGLGYKNLIFMVLQLESFLAAVEASAVDRPRVHVIVVEEPEAHLHPQMQYVFINEISKSLEVAEGVVAQVILSTHSSHIIANSGFDPVRYFRRSGRDVSIRDLSKLTVPTPGVLDFLRRYIKLTHCDLFFADKAVFVEGQVERLLIPAMIEECANAEGCTGFASQYISISEVGGAYAHKFKPIIDFLGVPTLVITDMDSVDAAGEKCPVGDGANKRTSNACLKTWLPAKEQIADLLACDDAAKIHGRIRVAFQVAEGGNCGRSFEEAFVYANADWLTANHAQLPATGPAIAKATTNGIAAGAWDLASKLGKVDFALDLIGKPGWKAPKYIRDGLEWLAKEGIGS
ncbi:AAA family ATPase [Sphingomonas suaedae]|uniref:AAA family ATPase n=1 Tax=Sphingomonas suaedae TaxID=2599297 RepID=A0A518RCB5_9SPHN|nr:AAA family ATPase [Sphingomonas suaedae]QDX25095.1 AAA family ATPase [Sphingomonas suaedae]